MSRPAYEICQVRVIEGKTEGGSKWRKRCHCSFVAEKDTPTGIQIIAQTKEIEVQGYGLAHVDEEAKLDNLYSSLKRQLLAEGWDLVDKEDKRGRDMWYFRDEDSFRPVFRRLLTEQSTEVEVPQSSGQSPTAVQLLEQLASLKDAGMLTQEEFETKKADILKRL